MVGVCYNARVLFPGAAELGSRGEVVGVADDRRRFCNELADRLLRSRSAMMKESSRDCEAFRRGSQWVW